VQIPDKRVKARTRSRGVQCAARLRLHHRKRGHHEDIALSRCHTTAAVPFLNNGNWDRLNTPEGYAMKIPRRKFLQFAGAALAVSPRCNAAMAQTFPSRPITMIVPFAAGGIGDVVGRVVAERMSRFLQQPVIVENVSGANGSIGLGRAARARSDGYTIELGVTSTHVLNAALYSLQYDVLTDFAPISTLASFPFVLFTRKTVPAKDLNELIAWLKANPNKASAGFATAASHLVTAFLQRQTGTQFALVPYRGAAPEMQDLVAGRIDLAFQPPDGLSVVRAGIIKAFALTGDRRLVVAPDIPTFSEMGFPALSFSTWFGLFAPKGTPASIISNLNAAAVDALADPAVRSRLVEIGMDIFPRDQQTPETLSALVKADAEKWWPIMKASGIKGE
jgi:tripartite-type tricarboxylate transporter receptor subunit TctC